VAGVSDHEAYYQLLRESLPMIPNPALILCSSDPQVRALHSARALDERR
jgi:hypothetical protein